MTAILTVTCDRCREPIESGRVVLRVETGASQPGWLIDQKTGRPSVDLCSVCFTTLTKWLRTGDHR
jgi:hypothetical protein